MPRHEEKRILPYTARQMYDLVADVEAYPQFLPWCAAARVRSRETEGEVETLEADLVISFKVFRERFGSRVELYESEQRIDTEYLEGPFRHMQSRWLFRDLPQGGCEIDFFVDFEMKNRVLQSVIGVVFTEAMHRIVHAFERRAAALYGTGA
jgi:coenzyme Q-binding protein COQ10